MERTELITEIVHNDQNIVQYELTEDMSGFRIMSTLGKHTEATNNTLANIAEFYVDYGGKRHLHIESSGIADIAEIAMMAEDMQVLPASHASGTDALPGSCFIPFPTLAGTILTIKFKSLVVATDGDAKLYAVYNGNVSKVMTALKYTWAKAAGSKLQLEKGAYLDSIRISKTIVATEKFKLKVNGFPALEDNFITNYLRYKPISAGVNTPTYIIPVGNPVSLNSELSRISASNSDWIVTLVYLRDVRRQNTSPEDSGSVIKKAPGSRATIPTTRVGRGF